MLSLRQIIVYLLPRDICNYSLIMCMNLIHITCKHKTALLNKGFLNIKTILMAISIFNFAAVKALAHLHAGNCNR